MPTTPEMLIGSPIVRPCAAPVVRMPGLACVTPVRAAVDVVSWPTEKPLTSDSSRLFDATEVTT